MGSLLDGGAIAQLSYLKTRGADGAYLVFQAATRVCPREVWASAAFALRFPAELRILQDAVATPGSKWQFFTGNNVEFLSKALRSKKLMGLVTSAEHAGFPRDFVRVHTAQSFLQEAACLCVRASHTCGA